MRVNTTTPNPANAYGNTVLDDATYYVRWMPWPSSGINTTGIEQYCFGIYHAGYCLNQPEYAATRDMDWCTALNPPRWLWDDNVAGEFEVLGSYAYLRNSLGVPVGSFCAGMGVYPWSAAPGEATLTQRVLNPPGNPKTGPYSGGTCLRRDESWEATCDIMYVNIDLPEFNPLDHHTFRTIHAFQDITLSVVPGGWADQYIWDIPGIAALLPADKSWMYEPFVTTGPTLAWAAIQARVAAYNEERHTAGLPRSGWSSGVVQVLATRDSRVEGWGGLGIDPSDWGVADALSFSVVNDCSTAIPDAVAFACPQPTHGFRVSGQTVETYYTNLHHFSHELAGQPSGVGWYGYEDVGASAILTVTDAEGEELVVQPRQVTIESGQVLSCNVPCGPEMVIWTDRYSYSEIVTPTDFAGARFPLHVRAECELGQMLFVDEIYITTFTFFIWIDYDIDLTPDGYDFNDLAVVTDCPGGPGPFQY